MIILTNHLSTACLLNKTKAITAHMASSTTGAAFGESKQEPLKPPFAGIDNIGARASARKIHFGHQAAVFADKVREVTAPEVAERPLSRVPCPVASMLTVQVVQTACSGREARGRRRIGWLFLGYAGPRGVGFWERPCAPPKSAE